MTTTAAALPTALSLPPLLPDPSLPPLPNFALPALFTEAEQIKRALGKLDHAYRTFQDRRMSTYSYEQKIAYKTKLTSDAQRAMARAMVRNMHQPHAPWCVTRTKTAAYWSDFDGKTKGARVGFSKNWKCAGCRVYLANQYAGYLKTALPSIEIMGVHLERAASVAQVPVAEIDSFLRKVRAKHKYVAARTDNTFLVIMEAHPDDGNAGFELVRASVAVERFARWLERPTGFAAGNRRIRSSKGWLTAEEEPSKSTVFDCTLEEFVEEVRKLDPQAVIAMGHDAFEIIPSNDFAKHVLKVWCGAEPSGPDEYIIPPGDILYDPNG